eukprot:COSAG01_NODE_34050_length_554_cov_1.261538_1_plen_83_part_10
MTRLGAGGEPPPAAGRRSLNHAPHRAHHHLPACLPAYRRTLQAHMSDITELARAAGHDVDMHEIIGVCVDDEIFDPEIFYATT